MIIMGTLVPKRRSLFLHSASVCVLQNIVLLRKLTSPQSLKLNIILMDNKIQNGGCPNYIFLDFVSPLKVMFYF